MRRLTAVVLAVALLGAGGGPSLSDIEDEVMCDTCNVALNIAESPRADQLRQEIRDLIAEGRSKEEVKEALADRYGPAILGLPEDEGFSLAAYAVPVLVVVGLLALALALLPRWRRRAPAATAAAGGPALSAADARRLDEDLARHET